MRPSVPDVHITDAEDGELAAYRALSGRAVLGLVCGLLAPLAMVDSLLWILPALGVLLSGSAIRRIKKSDAALTGRRMATAGLILSLVFAAAAPTNWLVYRRMVRNEARQFSALWFQFLTHRQPQKAFQLTVAPPVRQLLDHRLWAFYRTDTRQRQQLENYVKTPLIHTLLTLGPRAEARFYQTTGQTRENNNDEVEQVFAVIYEEEGEKKSFFVAVRAMRQKMATGEAAWRIINAAGVRADAL
jgi:hypothetical protein